MMEKPAAIDSARRSRLTSSSSCRRVRAPLHLAAVSYGPSVAALAMAALSDGEGGVAAAAGLVLNAALLGVAVAPVDERANIGSE